MSSPPGSRAGSAPSLPLASALERSEPLALLLRRLAESRARFEAVAPLLPEGLRKDVKPGSFEDGTWTLLAAHNPAAAKLRQMVPTLLQRLLEAGWQGTAIKVRVQPRDAAR